MNDPVFDLDLFVVVPPRSQTTCQKVEVTAVVLIQVFQVLGMVWTWCWVCVFRNFSRKPMEEYISGVKLELPQGFYAHADDHHSGVKSQMISSHI